MSCHRPTGRIAVDEFLRVLVTKNLPKEDGLGEHHPDHGPGSVKEALHLTCHGTMLYYALQ